MTAPHLPPNSAADAPSKKPFPINPRAIALLIAAFLVIALSVIITDSYSPRPRPAASQPAATPATGVRP